jgi:hypothetical protein
MMKLDLIELIVDAPGDYRTLHPQREFVTAALTGIRES